MAKEDFDVFWRTHLVTSSKGEMTLPEPSVLYWTATKEEASNFPWTRREGTPRAPAATAVARDLMTQVRVANKKNTISVSILQNCSPSYDSAQELLKAINLAAEKRIKIDMALTFVTLDKIRRPSWLWRGMTSAYNDVAVNESNDNALGLKLLHRAGVKLATFNPDTWKFLYSFLGLGLPTGAPGKFLGGKYTGASCDARLSEDKLVEMELKQILRGLHLTSPSMSPDHNTLALSWIPPNLDGSKISEYRVTGKRVNVKFRDADERSWRVQSVVEGSEFVVAVPGEVMTWKLAGLIRDTFYDVTVEAISRGTSICLGRKLFRTDEKAPTTTPVATPTPIRKTSAYSRPVVPTSPKGASHDGVRTSYVGDGRPSTPSIVNNNNNNNTSRNSKYSANSSCLDNSQDFSDDTFSVSSTSSGSSGLRSGEGGGSGNSNYSSVRGLARQNNATSRVQTPLSSSDTASATMSSQGSPVRNATERSSLRRSNSSVTEANRSSPSSSSLTLTPTRLVGLKRSSSSASSLSSKGRQP